MFYNFTASHGGIGLRPVQGILSDQEQDLLLDSTIANGGCISYKTNEDGTRAPNKINCNYLNLLFGTTKNEDLGMERFLLSQAFLLAFPGFPAIYFHSLVGSLNDIDGMVKSNDNRSINREKLNLNLLRKELNGSNSKRNLIFQKLRKLISIRKKTKAFHPFGSFQVKDSSSPLYVLQRSSDNESILFIF